MTCCHEYGCRRTKPILIRRGWLTGQWFAITDWRELVPAGSATGQPVIEANRKHDITDDLIAALIDAGWTPPASQPEEVAPK